MQSKAERSLIFLASSHAHMACRAETVWPQCVHHGMALQFCWTLFCRLDNTHRSHVHHKYQGKLLLYALIYNFFLSLKYPCIHTFFLLWMNTPHSEALATVTFRHASKECAGVGSVTPAVQVVVEACTLHIALEGWVF